MQLRGEDVQGMELASGLQLYSTRREAYVDDIRAIIRANNFLKSFANVSLRREDLPSQDELQKVAPVVPVDKVLPQASKPYFHGGELLSQN
jgi:Bax protein